MTGPLRPATWTLPVRLTLMVAALLVPLSVVIAFLEREDIEERRDAEVEHAVVSARTAAEVIDVFLEELEGVTLAIATLLGPPVLPFDQATIGPRLAAIGEQYPEVQSIFVTDLQGRVIAASTGRGTGTDLSSRPYIVRLRAGEQLVWSGSLSGIETGAVTVALGRRIEGAAGSPRGFVITAFYPERVVKALGLPGTARTTLIDERGTVIYDDKGVPAGQANVGVRHGVSQALRGEVVTLRGSETPYPGEGRYGALVPIARTGWVLARTGSAAQLDAVAAGHAVARVGITTALVLLGTALALLLAYGIARPLARLRRSAEAITRGERSSVGAVGGPPEVAALAAAMRTMQTAIAHREDESARLRGELEDALRSRDDFLAATARDVAIPIAILQASAETFQRRVTRGGHLDAGEVQEAFQRIRSAVEHVQAQIAQLTDLSRARTGQPIALDRRPTDLVALAVRLRGELQELAQSHSLVLDTDLRELRGDWDATRLERALTNLLLNAVRYSPPGSQVDLRLARTSDAAVIEVRDRGIGIPRSELTRVFSPFFRASNARATPGSGIGLAVVDQVIKGHGGDLAIESEEGNGTTVRISLPLSVRPVVVATEQAFDAVAAATVR